MGSALATWVFCWTKDTVFDRQSMSGSLSAFMSPARMPSTAASSTIARSRLGRSDRWKHPSSDDTSGAVYAEGTVECLWPGIRGAAAAASGPHKPIPAR